jgi:hypothetical protein
MADEAYAPAAAVVWPPTWLRELADPGPGIGALASGAEAKHTLPGRSGRAGATNWPIGSTRQMMCDLATVLDLSSWLLSIERQGRKPGLLQVHHDANIVGIEDPRPTLPRGPEWVGRQAVDTGVDGSQYSGQRS